jgi:hypothetical protein
LVLRGRRRDRSGLSARSGMYFLSGRRGRISTLTARRPLPVVKKAADHPQLADDVDQLTTGDDRNLLMSSWDRPKGSRMYATPIMKRTISLTSDAIVLTLASPFFAVWWIVRTVRRRRS